jgi:PAS domain S-box-containing protein
VAKVALGLHLHAGGLSATKRLNLVQQVYTQARPVALSQVTSEMVRALSADDEEADLIGQIGMGPCLILPLIACGRAVGVLVLAQDRSERTFSDADLPLFSSLTLSLAFAIDNTRIAGSFQQAAHERQQLGASFDEGESIFRTIFQSSEIGLVLFNSQQRLRISNPAFLRMVGYSAEELHELKVAEISHPDDLAVEGHLISEVIAGTRNDYRIEKRYIHKSGHTVPTHLTVVALRADNSDLRWMIAIIEDISARKQAEEALRASEARYRSLIEDQEDLVVRLLPDGTRTFVNNAYCRHFGRTREQLIGTSVYENIHPDDIEQVRQRAVTYASGGNPQIGLSRGIRPDGSACWFEWTGRGIFNSEGSLIEVQSVGRDVTERQRAVAELITLERKMLEAQKFESLGVLAGGIAHDFNNILTAILGHAELALLDLPPHVEMRTNMQMIIEGAQRAADLTRQILAYSGKGRAIIQRVGWNELIDAMEDLLRTAVVQRCRLTLIRGASLPLVEADASQLRQVMLNLVVNASESFEMVDSDGGDIVVATGVAELGRADLDKLAFGSDLLPGSYVYLMVGDDGCGMEADTLARIFDPFFSTKFIGRGLGLAAVQGIVRSHRGTLRVTSKPGIGTTVMIWLPAVAI